MTGTRPGGSAARSARSRVARAAAPALLKPIRLTIAWLAGARNSRGLGLPGWGWRVTVPTSMKPKPSAGQTGSARPSLSIPAARPTGFGKRTPKTVRGAATA